MRLHVQATHLLICAGLVAVLAACGQVARIPEAEVDLSSSVTRVLEAPATERQTEDIHVTTPSLSANGLVAGFTSHNSLLPIDTNGWVDVYVLDRLTDGLELVSVARDGTAANGHNWGPSMSWDGRFVAFAGYSSNLTPTPTATLRNVFVRDRVTEHTEMVSVANDGSPADADSDMQNLSLDGAVVAYHSYATNLVEGDANLKGDVFVRDLALGVTECVSVNDGGEFGNGASVSPAVSGDGRYVAFASDASNLVPDDTNGHRDVFVRDRRLQTTRRVSLSSSGNEGNADSGVGSGAVSISADGTLVAFVSTASNLVPDDANPWSDVFVHDLTTGATVRVSVSSGGAEADAPSERAVLSALGNVVTFDSGASTLVPMDWGGFEDVFVHDLRSGATTRASLADDGAEANDGSRTGTPSSDGLFIGFESEAWNLVPDDVPMPPYQGNDFFVRATATSEAALATLIHEIEIRAPDVLLAGRAEALVRLLGAARASLLSGRRGAACRQVDAFLRLVDEGSAGFANDVTVLALRASAEGIRATITCAGDDEQAFGDAILRTYLGAPLEYYDREFVAIDGDHALLPVLRDAMGQPLEGRVDVYARTPSGMWGYERSLFPPSDGTSHVGFGKALELRGTTAAIMSASDGEAVILVYERAAFGAWNLRATLLRGEGIGTTWREASMALSPGVLVVGLPRVDGGIARVYEQDHGGVGAWGLATTIAAPPDLVRRSFGTDVDVAEAGDLIAVANSEQNNDSGLGIHEAACLYERSRRDPSRWDLVDVLRWPELPSSQSTYVEIDGDTLAVTHMPATIAFFADVHVFERGVGGKDNWGLVATRRMQLELAGGVRVSYAHTSLRLRGTTIIAAIAPVRCFSLDADPLDAPLDCGAGQVHVYERDVDRADPWTEIEVIEPFPPFERQLFGAALDLSSDGRSLIVGTNPRASGSYPEPQGEGFVFVR